ncbi:hypothetical protein BLOT_014804 [Blomia tropicalis]|nr:hypothetical protein BLOT_014804 [Blomia tropicalis]
MLPSPPPISLCAILAFYHLPSETIHKPDQISLSLLANLNCVIAFEYDYDYDYDDDQSVSISEVGKERNKQ